MKYWILVIVVLVIGTGLLAFEGSVKQHTDEAEFQLRAERIHFEGRAMARQFCANGYENTMIGVESVENLRQGVPEQ